MDLRTPVLVGCGQVKQRATIRARRASTVGVLELG